jgi:ArsR family transcriptional regulator
MSRARPTRAPGPRRHRRPHANGAPALDSDGIERVRRALLDQERVERLSRTFRALGDPTRSRMVLALSIAELCVSDLARTVGTSLSATSHQLRILRELDIVRVRRAGRSQLYALNEQAFGFCAPRVCQAWQQTLAPGTVPAPSDES